MAEWLEALTWRFESNQVSIPGMGSYCLPTLMSSDRTKQICLWMTIYIGVERERLRDAMRKREKTERNERRVYFGREEKRVNE